MPRENSLIIIVTWKWRHDSLGEFNLLANIQIGKISTYQAQFLKGTVGSGVWKIFKFPVQKWDF